MTNVWGAKVEAFVDCVRAHFGIGGIPGIVHRPCARPGAGSARFGPVSRRRKAGA